MKKAMIVAPLAIFACAYADDDGFRKYTNHNPDLPEHALNPAAFAAPPDFAKPCTWWHWINGNVSREGIATDLSEMADKGLGGARIFHLNSRLKGPVIFNSPEWFDTFRFVNETAAKHGLSIGIHNCDGWSTAGGPWVTPELSMKELTLKTIRVTGRADGAEQSIELPALEHRRAYANDIAVLAWPAKRPAHLAMHKPGALRRVSAASGHTIVANGKGELVLSGAALDRDKPDAPGNPLSLLFDGRIGEKQRISLSHDNANPGQFCGVTLEFAEPFEAAGVFTEIYWNYEKPLNIFLECSDDGTRFEKVCELAFQPQRADTSESFPPRKARYWRLVRYTSKNPSANVRRGIVEEHLLRVSELELLAPGEVSRAAAPIENFDVKAGVAHAGGGVTATTAPWPSECTLKPSEILNLTGRFTAASGRDAGVLRWAAPPGEWVVMRVGYTTTDRGNHPATAAGYGLEVDKFESAALAHHFDTYVAKMIDAAGPLAGKTFSIIATDSWEAGCQNWTQNFERYFRERNGYDILPWLPVYAGECIGSVDTTERFLFDLRQTFSALVMKNFFGTFATLTRARGLKYEAEPAGDVYLRNAMNLFRETDYPMTEVWQKPREPGVVAGARQGIHHDLSSAAHFYGKKFITCEALSCDKGNWSETPWVMKGTLDTLLLGGVNTAVFHSYTHQPDERAPGWQMEPWGISQNRKLPWWRFSHDWFRYIARTQYMLQQGKCATRILLLYSDEVPDTGAGMSIQGNHLYDVIEGDGARNFLRVEDGKLVSPGRMSYALMVISPNAALRLETLEKLKLLLEAGATISAQKKPAAALTLRGGPDAEARWRTLADELFGDGSKAVRRIGKGALHIAHTPNDMVKLLGLREPFTCALDNAHDAKDIGWTHREHTDDSEWFWLINCDSEAPRSGIMSFAVAGKTATLWHPETGIIEPVPVLDEADGRTRIPLTLEKLEGVFVVFTKAGGAPKPAAASVSIDGTQTFPTPSAVAVDNAAIAKNFTVLLTVSPTAERKISEPKTSGILSLDNENIVLNPEQMHIRMGDNAHACAGLSVGKNSIAVFEHGADFLNSVLVWDNPVPENARIALVYKDNVPALYLNGVPIAAGTASGRTVHPPSSLRSFKGKARDFEAVASALDATEIAARNAAADTKTAQPAKKAPRMFMTGAGKLGAEFFVPGNVSLKKTDGGAVTLAAEKIPAPKTLTAPWTVAFDAKWGAPAEPQRFDKLISWTESPEPGIRHYSGTAIYTQDIELDARDVAASQRIYLEIGQVCEVAEITVNGKRAGTLWRPPWRIDITDCARVGKNTLQIAVANTWVNRCLYDATLPEPERLTWANSMETHYPDPKTIKPSDWGPWQYGPLPSGLIGEAKISFSQVVVEKE